ncbi:MAG: hypothetical protein IJT30_06675 [Muribaculaceae bacterium]|nr:hypothetical protein [Muribaculaceae bacterium]
MSEYIRHISSEDLGAYLEGNLGDAESALLAQLLDDSDVLRELADEAETLDIEWDSEPEGDLPDMDWLTDDDLQECDPHCDTDIDDTDFDLPDDDDLLDFDL